MGPGGSWCRRLGQEMPDTRPPLGPQTRASGSSQQEAEDHRGAGVKPVGEIRVCVADRGQGALRAKGKKSLEERPSAGTRGTQRGVPDGKTLNTKQDRARQERGRKPTDPQHGPRGLSVPQVEARCGYCPLPRAQKVPEIQEQRGRRGPGFNQG